jgi:hypothetical protein
MPQMPTKKRPQEYESDDDIVVLDDNGAQPSTSRKRCKTIPESEDEEEAEDDEIERDFHTAMGRTAMEREIANTIQPMSRLCAIRAATLLPKEWY